MYKTDIKDSLEECYSKFKMVEGRISGLEDRSIKTFIDTLILGGGKYDFKKKILAERGKFHNDKRLNSSKRYSNYKYICT